MNFKEYITEPIWNKKKAIAFLAEMEEVFDKSKIKVKITGSVALKGESDSDLDLAVERETSTSYERLIKNLKKHPLVEKVTTNEEAYKNNDTDSLVVSVMLKPDRRVVDIIFC
jgi:predicted nucleotidyltransferase